MHSYVPIPYIPIYYAYMKWKPKILIFSNIKTRKGELYNNYSPGSGFSWFFLWLKNVKPWIKCCIIGKDFVYHVCGHEFESRLKWKFSNFPHHLWLLLSDYRGMAKCFGAHYNQEVRFISAVKCKKGPQVPTSLLINEKNIIIKLILISKTSQ